MINSADISIFFVFLFCHPPAYGSYLETAIILRFEYFVLFPPFTAYYLLFIGNNALDLCISFYITFR